jgi:ribosomal protein L7Ae-like RNA K-turn-binding protein
LRKRVGGEWTKLHYQNHRRDRNERLIKEKIALVERVLASGGHTHLMLAGNPRILAQVRKSLTKSLERKLVDVIPASARDRSKDIVVATLSSFIEREERESVAAVHLLQQELRRGGLAVCGYGDSRKALERGQADQLIILAERDDAHAARREELAELALQHDVPVEVVQHSEALTELGGVGCLLRYETRAPSMAAVKQDAA